MALERFLGVFGEREKGVTVWVSELYREDEVRWRNVIGKWSEMDRLGWE